MILSEGLLAAIFAAQVAQLGFEARLIQRVSKLEVRLQALRERYAEVAQ
jgi:hypothetical protein